MIPVYRQIYERFRGAIASGVLKPGDRMPSMRALTKELGVARGTVEAAYGLLSAEGYIQARGQAGTVVTPDLALPAAQSGRPTAAHAGASPGSRTALGEKWGQINPFQMGLPALDAFPRKIWARLGARCVRAMQAADMAYPCSDGIPPLRTAIAAYLQVSRGIACSPAQVFVTTGYRHTLSLIVRALLARGDEVWLEDPGYPPTRELIAEAQLRGVPVPVDAEGLDVAQGLKLAPGARAAVVTPSHQSPLCLTLTLPRRLALLDWASRAQAWIIEDDYDGEYRYASQPLPALKSVDRDGRVLYAGTFSKVLFPGVRLAYLVVPEDQVARFTQTSQTFSGGAPNLMQSLVTAFMAEGHFARHIQRMRRLYKERREIAADGLAGVLDRHLRIDPQPGGMHLVLRLRDGLPDAPLARRLREHDMAAHALTQWGIARDPGAALLLNFTNIDSRETARRLGGRILELL
ncbi:DNA-binding protein [Bordetella genomosp. 8]|uniref:DNA-binding protein n=1 Tax=Bordetella genomosp. 8 TaxID=1416806 RepID=A0A1W6YQ73_9BORD|nr:PLP-dependent aminotransferase family protein [Bordetella genomosp. 8]ARP83207.1 DNA-binding protein [Bordetella genomosp. 8]